MEQTTYYDADDLKAALDMIASLAPDAMLSDIGDDLVMVSADLSEADQGRIAIKLEPSPTLQRFVKDLQDG